MTFMEFHLRCYAISPINVNIKDIEKPWNRRREKRETPEMHSMRVKVDHEAVRSLSITIKSCFEQSEEIKTTTRMITAQMHKCMASLQKNSRKTVANFYTREKQIKELLNQII
jgi:hypothetical protein